VISSIKFVEVGADASLSCPHIFGELDLARESGAIVPCIFKKHRVCELGADGEFLLRENEIRNLREAVPRHGISTDDLDVALCQPRSEFALKPAV
jgi:hypothetical protein